jgi:hypothetical protein
MKASKFTELLDTSVAPITSERNVSLEDILAETRRRSSSTSGGDDSGKSSPDNTPSPSPTSPLRTKMRRFTLSGKIRSD